MSLRRKITFENCPLTSPCRLWPKAPLPHSATLVISSSLAGYLFFKVNLHRPMRFYKLD